MTARAGLPCPLSRRAAMVLSLLAPAALAACVSAPPPVMVFPPLDYDYLTKLRLDTASIDVENAWTPQPVPDGVHVEAQAPVPPTEALRAMARDRLVAAGNGGRTTFVIDDASLIQIGDRIEANFAVHIDISSADGTRTGYAEARVSRTRSVPDFSPDNAPQVLYGLVKAAMDDMNVEFEFQVRRSLHDWLLSTSPDAPEPPPVKQQPLEPPPPS